MSHLMDSAALVTVATPASDLSSEIVAASIDTVDRGVTTILRLTATRVMAAARRSDN
ncbi:uncharacterized protein N7477_004120 [Penicillium maclennaniae]|uniref:uncharacterized protein n=1 Tax=Penicillium maclennaniae TaxID=1343394 RepID=UPI002541E8CF|nr:uncharacterized protein N7477_004120 [Penicillium maclennaniae]KAJ5678487.1 hypothetical protein N7477_004120 [Penicillium maclennaniae]